MIFLSYVWIMVCALLLFHGIGWALPGGKIGFISLIGFLLSDVVFLNYSEGYWDKKNAVD